MAKNDTLTRGMVKAIPALLASTSVTDAASQAGLSRSTIYRYLKDEDFQRELRGQQDALLAASTANLVGKLEGVLRELYRIAIDGERDSVRVQAIRAWLGYMHESIELRELVERVERLEGVLDDKD